MKRLYVHVALLILSVQIVPVFSAAQAPPNEFYHSPFTVLPYASLLLTLPDGSHKNLPFTPIIVNNTPAGTETLSRDIDIRGRLVFAGNGIVAPDKEYNSFGTMNMQGRIAVILYNVPDDFQEQYGEKSDLHARVHEAVQRGVTAIILFGIPGKQGWNAPAISFPETIPPLSVPVITLSYAHGIELLELGGIILDFSGEREERILPEFEPIEMPVIARLTVKGQFNLMETRHFTVRYLPGILNSARIQRFVNDKERALKFLTDLLLVSDLTYPIETVVYFPDYTSFFFYTGNEIEFENEIGGFELFPIRPERIHRTTYQFFVKELATDVTRLGWGQSLLSIEAGFASMAEHFADADGTLDLDQAVADWIAGNRLPPTVSVLSSDYESGTELADTLSVSAGSFLKFLWTAYSTAKFKRLYLDLPKKENPKECLAFFEEIYFKDFIALEREWVEMLALKYSLEGNAADRYMQQSQSAVNSLMEVRD
ncbi:hypothetical protein ACFL5L_02125 [candidate division KSB1 bacterium]